MTNRRSGFCRTSRTLPICPWSSSDATHRWREVDSNFRFREDESSIETPLGHKDHSWSFLHFDTITVTVADAYRPCSAGILGRALIRTTRRQRMIPALLGPGRGGRV